MSVKVNSILNGDSMEMLRTLPDQSVDMCVTSPPYYGLRDYGEDGQIGLEETPGKYVQRLVDVFREVRRVLKDDGTLWLNIGDSYAASGMGGNPKESKYRKQATNKGSLISGRKAPGDLKPKDLIGIPWMVAFALRSDGWYLRQDIIWHKPNPMPESVKDRCTKAHEYIFLMSKSAKYYYDHEAIKDPVAESTVRRGDVEFGGSKGRKYDPEEGDPNFRNGHHQWGRTYSYADCSKNGVNKKSVWKVSTKPYPEAHFAVFPDDLIKPCVLAGSRKGGVVLDPFFGSGTTGEVAIRAGRKFIGIELNPEYVELANKRLSPFLSQRNLFEIETHKK